MPGLFSLPKNLCLDESARVLAGELKGAAARLEWDQMPRKALQGKAFSERSEDFSAAQRRKSNGIFPVYASARTSPAIRSPSSAPRPKST